jgi:hypothetical protein
MWSSRAEEEKSCVGHVWSSCACGGIGDIDIERVVVSSMRVVEHGSVGHRSVLLDWMRGVA